MNDYYERAAHAWTADSIRIIATPSSLAKSSLYYVQEAGHFRTFPTYFTERYRLPSYLIVYTVTGQGRLTYGNKTYTLRPGQLFFIDCREYQHYTTHPEELWEILWVHVNGSATRTYYEQFASDSTPVISLPVNSAIPALIRQIIDTHRSISYRTELMGSMLIVQVLTELLLTVKGRGMPSTAIPAYIGDLVTHMEQHFMNKTTLDEYALLCNMSKYHLAKMFKRYIGLSPNEYLIHIRISHAKELLKYSDHPVALVASSIGIDNVSHFINLFKARVGHTPLAYRRRWNQTVPSPE